MILEKINKSFGVKLFKNPNTLNYNLFNFFLKKYVINKNVDILKSYHNLGYIKPNVDSVEIAKYLSKKISSSNAREIKSMSNKYTTVFMIDEEMRNKIKDHLNIKFKKLIEALKKYYRNDIAVLNVQIRRNYGLRDKSFYSKKIKNKNFEFYNMYFHCDYYTMNYFKLFINLQDITTNDGPLTFYSIKDTKKFVSQSKYKNRNFYSDLKLDSEIQNCGNLGDSLILNTSQCIHRAGIPKFGNHRDVLFINFVALPKKINDIFYFEKDYEDEIWGSSNILAKKFSKPKNLRETYNLYKDFKTKYIKD
jgi:hypothetical protein